MRCQCSWTNKHISLVDLSHIFVGLIWIVCRWADHSNKFVSTLLALRFSVLLCKGDCIPRIPTFCRYRLMLLLVEQTCLYFAHDLSLIVIRCCCIYAWIHMTAITICCSFGWTFRGWDLSITAIDTWHFLRAFALLTINSISVHWCLTHTTIQSGTCSASSNCISYPVWTCPKQCWVWNRITKRIA